METLLNDLRSPDYSHHGRRVDLLFRGDEGSHLALSAWQLPY